MNDKERERSERARPAVESTADEGAIGGAHADAEQLLQAADEAIARALSLNSEQFLQATRQSSGQ
jgi:hypothetical protein